jgi:hypothetical protein
MWPTPSVPAAYRPHKPEDLHVGYGVQLDPSTITDQEEAYSSDPAAWVWEALNAFGGSAPVECVLKTLADDGYFSPEEVLFDAINDDAGGFSFYPLR